MPNILTISPSKECLAVIHKSLNNTKWAVWEERTYRGALRYLAFDRPAVILCDCPLDEGSWKDVLSHIAPLSDAPQLIVTCRPTDASLWSEVLNLGGFDMLVQPLDSEEVTRVVSAAGRAWESLWRRALPGKETRMAVAA